MKDEAIARVLILQARGIQASDDEVRATGLDLSRASLYIQGFGDGLTMMTLDAEVGAMVSEHLHREAFQGLDLDDDVRDMIKALRREL